MAHVIMYQTSTLEELKLIVEDFTANINQEGGSRLELSFTRII